MSGTYARGSDGGAMHRSAVEWLGLAAAPTFAAMAMLTGLSGGPPSMLCSAAPDASPLNGMVLMYLLMSAFHSGPWLKLISSRPGGRDTVVRFDPKPDGDGCWLALTHTGLSPKAGGGAGIRAGWHAHLEGLPDAIDGKKTAWATKTTREGVVSSLYPPLPA